MITRKMREKCNDSILSVALIVILITVTVLACGNTQQKELVKAAHIVQSGETVSQIASMYCPPHYSYSERRQFEHDIIYAFNAELFKCRTPGMIYPGDVLHMQFTAIVNRD